MTSASDHDEGAAVAARIERRWTIMSALHRRPAGRHGDLRRHPSGDHAAGLGGNREPADAAHLGRIHRKQSRQRRRGRRFGDGPRVGQQFSFTPQCILVPTGTPISFRATSADVVHGFLIEHTNINSMLVPGYVSVLPAKFDAPGEHPMPCQEFCGIGHEGMWAKVKVIDKATSSRWPPTSGG
jgi:cytochrome c oxidase subunit 2